MAAPTATLLPSLRGVSPVRRFAHLPQTLRPSLVHTPPGSLVGASATVVLEASPPASTASVLPNSELIFEQARSAPSATNASPSVESKLGRRFEKFMRVARRATFHRLPASAPWG